MPAKASVPRAVPPLKELERLLPKLTGRELYTAAIAIFDEASRRASNYADLIDEEGVDPSVLEEGLAFAHRFRGLFTGYLPENPRYCWASQELRESENALEAAWAS